MGLRSNIGAVVLLSSLGGLLGCHPTREHFLCDHQQLHSFKDQATAIEYPDVQSVRLKEVSMSLPPNTLRSDQITEYWELSLEEAIRTALTNSSVMRDLGGRVLTTPASVNTVYEPALQESDPRFGVEGALSAFDTTFATSMFWQRNDRVVNQVFTGLNQKIFEQDLGTFQAQLSRTAATGTSYFARNNTTYEFNNNSSNQFPSAWNTNFEVGFQHPLLQGNGISFNRIAGPSSNLGLLSSRGFGGANGVLLARINSDVTLADFEAGVRRLVSDVENSYWDLYFAYRELDARKAGRDSALETWRRIYALYVEGAIGGDAAKEALAREQYYLFRGSVENALSGVAGGGTQSGSGTGAGLFRGAGGVYARESNLRLLMGLAPTDGRLIRPIDEPTTARVEYDWNEVLPEALCRRVELRRQRWIVKRQELILLASRNFLQPRFDLAATYRWRGFGDDFWSTNGGTQYSNAMADLFGGQNQEWQAGGIFSMPIGFRQALAGVRNSELALARERTVLVEQELQVAHDLSGAIREVHRAYQLAETNFNRRVAAQRQVEAVSEAYRVNSITLDVLLDAQRRLAEAETEYYRSLVEYMLAIKSVEFERGSLLDYNGIYLTEGPWPDKAYQDARKRAIRRMHATEIDYGMTLPTTVSRGILRQPAGDFTPLGAETLYEGQLPSEALLHSEMLPAEMLPAESPNDPAEDPAPAFPPPRAGMLKKNWTPQRVHDPGPARPSAPAPAKVANAAQVVEAPATPDLFPLLVPPQPVSPQPVSLPKEAATSKSLVPAPPEVTETAPQNFDAGPRGASLTQSETPVRIPAPAAIPGEARVTIRKAANWAPTSLRRVPTATVPSAPDAPESEAGRAETPANRASDRDAARWQRANRADARGSVSRESADDLP